MHRAVLSLGSNLGDRAAWLRFARSAIAQLPETRILKSASEYETAPCDVPGQYAHLTFLNSALLIETALPPHTLLKSLQKIETDAGRIRCERNGPRTLDIDIITYDDLTLDTPDLILPHPHAHLRSFVLLPVREILPELAESFEQRPG